MKGLLAGMLLICTVFRASAQINATLFPVVSDSVSNNSVSLATNVTGITGSYFHAYLYKVTGDTAWTMATATLTNQSPYWKRLNGLLASTSYDIAAIATKNGVSDTSNLRQVTTKDSVPPAPLSITNISVNANVGQTRVLFHYKFLTYQANVRFYYQAFQYSTSPLTLQGEGDTSIVVTSPNVAGTPYQDNLLFAEVLGSVPGISQDSIFEVPNYSVPNAQSADVTSASLSANGYDSQTLSTEINVGNTSSANVKLSFHDSIGTQLSQVQVTISHDTVITWTRTGLPTYTPYFFKVKATSTGGSDSAQTPATRTLQVPMVTLNSVDTVNAWYSSTKLTVNVSTNGTWNASTSRTWASWVDSLGATRFTDTITGIMGQNQTRTFTTVLDKLNENPATNAVMVYVVNGAGAPSSMFQFKLPMRKTPSFSSLAATVIYVDSFKVSAYDSIGSGGGPTTSTYQAYDSVGTLMGQVTKPITVNGFTSFSKTGLTPGAKYTVVHTVSKNGVGMKKDSVSFYLLMISPTVTVDSFSKNKDSILLYLKMQRNGSAWAHTIIDSLVVNDGGVQVIAKWRPIGTASSGQYVAVISGLNAGTSHNFDGYVENAGNLRAYFSLPTITTLPAAPAATGDWGIEYSYSGHIEWVGMTYDVPEGNATYRLSFRKVFPGTTGWTPMPLGMVSDNGSFANVNATPLQGASTYEFKYESWNEDSVHWVHPLIKTVSTEPAKNPLVGAVVINSQTSNNVQGTVNGSGEGTESQAYCKLYKLTNGSPVEIDATQEFNVGTDLFSIDYDFLLPEQAYYELRGVAMDMNDANKNSKSKFFNNLSTGIATIEQDTCTSFECELKEFNRILRPQLKSSVCDLSGRVLIDGDFTFTELKETLEGLNTDQWGDIRYVIIYPKDAHYRNTYGGVTVPINMGY